MKQKVVIVTINISYNIGNKLQNYALKKTLENLGYRVCTLKNIYNLTSKKAKVLKKLSPTALLAIYRLKRVLGFDKLESQRMIEYVKFDKKLGNKYYSKHALKSLSKKISAFVAGSDQVWNFDFQINDMEINMLGFYTDGAKKISYAASVGMKQFSDVQGETVKKYLPSFDSLSVRENDAKRLIEPIVGKEVKVVLDPTLLLDSAQWDKIALKPKWYDGSDYALIYFLGEKDDKFIKLIDELKQAKGLKIIDPLDKKSPSYQCGPAQFVYLIKNSKCVVTDSYHATVFSLIYQKPVAVLTGKGDRAKMSGRFDTLKENLGLDSIFDCYDADKMFDVSYDNIQDKLKEARLASLAFIRDGLK